MGVIEHFLKYAARGIEVIGVLIIAGGVVICLGKYLLGKLKANDYSYLNLRHELGKAILLGLEIMVAGDIIATVITKPTLDKVAVLAIIVLIRTFLSFSLQVEIEGKLPWQSKKKGSGKSMED